jgi:hypothetical protein
MDQFIIDLGKKLALTSRRSGGRWVGIVCLRTKRNVVESSEKRFHVQSKMKTGCEKEGGDLPPLLKHWRQPTHCWVNSGQGPTLSQCGRWDVTSAGVAVHGANMPPQQRLGPQTCRQHGVVCIRVWRWPENQRDTKGRTFSFLGRRWACDSALQRPVH